MAKNMRTDRITLVTLTPYLARVALEDRAKLGLMLEARVPITWPGADFARMLEHLAEGGERASLWAEQTRLIVHEEDRTLIGETGFHGPPDRSGTVEVGYSIVPDYRGEDSRSRRREPRSTRQSPGQKYAGSPPHATTITRPH
jgi:ribosomal-protein-alanine N-acetyltransferase